MFLNPCVSIDFQLFFQLCGKFTQIHLSFLFIVLRILYMFIVHFVQIQALFLPSNSLPIPPALLSPITKIFHGNQFSPVSVDCMCMDVGRSTERWVASQGTYLWRKLALFCAVYPSVAKSILARGRTYDPSSSMLGFYLTCSADLVSAIIVTLCSCLQRHYNVGKHYFYFSSVFTS